MTEQIYNNTNSYQSHFCKRMDFFVINEFTAMGSFLDFFYLKRKIKITKKKEEKKQTLSCFLFF